jgi:hypothetical protein
VYASAHKPTKRSVAFACARHLACALPRAHSLHTTTLFVSRCRPDPPTHPLSFSCACTRPEESFAQLGNNVVPRPLPALAHAGASAPLGSMRLGRRPAFACEARRSVDGCGALDGGRSLGCAPTPDSKRLWHK